MIVEPIDLIRHFSEREPLNPYQAAGMASVIKQSGIKLDDPLDLVADRLPQVLMLLDRTGEEAAPYLVRVRLEGASLILFPRFMSESLDHLGLLTSFRGRREAIREKLVPVLSEIPNWLELVRIMSHYCMERDDESLGIHLSEVVEIIFNYFEAGILQPFDPLASSESEYQLCRFIESGLKSASCTAISVYRDLVSTGLDFLREKAFSRQINSLERRLVEINSIRLALEKRSEDNHESLFDKTDLLLAQALHTALGELSPISNDLVQKLSESLIKSDFAGKAIFERDIFLRIKTHAGDEISNRRIELECILSGNRSPYPEVLRSGVNYVMSISEDWKSILASFQEIGESVPAIVQEAFAEVLASQILEIKKPDIKQTLVDGLCRVVLSLEKTRKKSSRDLVNTLADLFLDRAYSSQATDEVVSALKAVESLGVMLGTSNYSLMAEELLDHLVRRPLIQPKEKRFTMEDDDTGEPVVLAEDAGAYRGHIQHIKSIISVISSNPRIMLRLVPYLVVQTEIGQTRLVDEDFIQLSISGLLRANSPVTHFLVRTLIKALPYSFKEIGPLENLRLTAAGLAKELANRGVKPIGNFLGKLRGDIHWRGSIENLFFSEGILRYLATGKREHLSEWMPPESMPYMGMDNWCSPSEAEGIRELCEKIFTDNGIDPSKKDAMDGLLGVDTATYRNRPEWPELARTIVLDMVELVQGLHAKYLVTHQSISGSTVNDDLAKFEKVVSGRMDIMSGVLTPDIRNPLPKTVVLTEGTYEAAQELERLKKEQPETPVILIAKKAGHAYAQKAIYLEPRFEAFNEDLGEESLQETLATSISNAHFDEITLKNLPIALLFLDLLIRGLAANGHSSYYLLQAGADLRNSSELGLTLDKVRDILKIIKKELDDVQTAYREWFEGPLDDFLSQCPMDRLPRKLKDLTTLKQVPDTDFYKNYLKTTYITDLQARDGNLRVLETFLDKVEAFLNQRLSESHRMVGEQTESSLEKLPFYFPRSGEISPCTIGLKASLLSFAENTPPYFVITTDQSMGMSSRMVSDNIFREGLARTVSQLGEIWGKRLGDAENPAMFSVRSGARVSMPGMMTTITNVGINDEVAESLAEKVGIWFAYDCYRRFLQEFSQSVFGVERDEFQEIIDERKEQFKVARKANMSADQMKSLAFDYKRRVSQLAPKVVEWLDSGNFLEILTHSALTVLNSIESQAAKKYRTAAGIDGKWQTPVIVQAMVYGNMEPNSSGTGVVSYNPFTREIRGDFSPGDQGTDVVDGKVFTLPVYDPWKIKECLASQMPEAWKELSSVLFRTAEKLHFDTRMEFTIEKGKVFILQIRKDRERKERLPSLASMGYRVIAQGTGVSGKIFRGIMVTDRNQIAPFRHINKAQSIIDAMNESLSESERLDGFIFVVNDPIPEEIMEEVFSLPIETALVSRLGGRGAHAADISKALGKVYVGQLRQIDKFAGKPESVNFNEQEIVVGRKMIIHGQTGEIALYKKN